MFSNDRQCLHAVRKKRSFPRRTSGGGRMLVCSSFLEITNRRLLQVGEVDGKEDKRRKEEGKTEQADSHYY